MDESDEVAVVFGGSAEEFKLRVVLLSFTQSHQKVFTVFGTILSSVLYNGLISFRHLLRHLSDIFLRVWLFQFHKYLRKQGLLLIDGSFLDFRFRRWCLLLFDVLFGLLRLHALDHLFADFGDSVVVEGAVGTVEFEEGELWFILLPLGEDLLEIRAIDSHVLCCLIDKFWS
jgi:hypothetical protein